MVTCNLIGRTGNQMFIIAATIAYAVRYGLQFHIPATGTFKHLTNPAFDMTLSVVKINEAAFHYNPLPVMAPGFHCNIELNGYFQSDKYFQDCPEVLGLFNIPYKMMEGWTAIHYRCGDYKNKPDCHPIVSEDYLRQAISKMMDFGFNKFIVFSDEMDIAIKVLPRPDNAFFRFTKSGSQLADISLASSCENIIGSNSSFSLWIYYLNRNKNKIGIFPKRWFGPKLPHNTNDLIPSNCIVI